MYDLTCPYSYANNNIGTILMKSSPWSWRWWCFECEGIHEIMAKDYIELEQMVVKILFLHKDPEVEFFYRCWLSNGEYVQRTMSIPRIIGYKCRKKGTDFGDGRISLLLNINGYIQWKLWVHGTIPLLGQQPPWVTPYELELFLFGYWWWNSTTSFSCTEDF